MWRLFVIINGYKPLELKLRDGLTDNKAWVFAQYYTDLKTAKLELLDGSLLMIPEAKMQSVHFLLKKVG